MKCSFPKSCLATAMSVTLLACSVDLAPEAESNGNSQVAAAAGALSGGAGLAAASIALPVVLVAASGAVILYTASEVRAQFEQEMRQAVLSSLVDWRDAGLPAHTNWYRIAFDATFAVDSDLSQADFADTFTYQISPHVIAQLADPSHSAYKYAQIELTDVSALHAAVVAHLAKPETMLELARHTLVPEFLNTSDFEAHVPAIRELFTNFRASAFTGLREVELTAWTLSQLTALSGTLLSATNSFQSTLQQQAALTAQVHAAFLTGVLRAASQVHAATVEQDQRAWKDEAGMQEVAGELKREAENRLNEVEKAAAALKGAIIGTAAAKEQAEAAEALGVAAQKEAAALVGYAEGLSERNAGGEYRNPQGSATAKALTQGAIDRLDTAANRLGNAANILKKRARQLK